MRVHSALTLLRPLCIHFSMHNAILGAYLHVHQCNFMWLTTTLVFLCNVCMRFPGFILPGGIGSCGAPNDGGVHQNFHFIRQGYQRAALGWHRNASKAKDAGDFELNNAGDIKMQVALPISLESDVYALQCIKEYERGKLTLWAWCSRGYCSMNDIAKWHCDGDIEAAEKLMAPMDSRAFTRYVQDLTTLPALTILGEHEGHAPLVEPDAGLLSGEKVHLWFVDRGAEGMIALPAWTSMHIECALALWRHEEEKWKDKILQRFPKALTASQQRQYDNWLETSTRRVVLDQHSKQAIKNPAACARSYLVKHGVLLEARLEFYTWFFSTR